MWINVVVSLGLKTVERWQQSFTKNMFFVSCSCHHYSFRSFLPSEKQNLQSHVVCGNQPFFVLQVCKRHRERTAEGTAHLGLTQGKSYNSCGATWCYKCTMRSITIPATFGSSLVHSADFRTLWSSTSVSNKHLEFCVGPLRFGFNCCAAAALSASV